MIVSYEEVREILSELIDELPEPFFKELNLGVILEDKAMLHPDSNPQKPLYTLGQYSRNALGKQITIFYGSLERLYPYYDKERLTEKLREVLRHEFRHHVEFLAGERDLEIYDQEILRKYFFGLEGEATIE
ncbi:metallopeptidase family protein [Guggenheimella bovis]